MIQFSADESVGCRMMPNEIQFFDPKDFTKGVLSRIRMPGIAAMQLATAPGSHVAGFVPEAKGFPASVQIFSCNKDAQNQAVARRSFFRCSTVQLHWNKGSTGLLVLAQADVDKTNQSYYGETKLNYLTTDRAFEGIVPLKKDGQCMMSNGLLWALNLLWFMDLCRPRLQYSTKSATLFLSLVKDLTIP